MNLQPDTPEKSIFYEIGMFRFAAGRLISGELKQGNAHDAFLEVFLLHFRNLYEFFYEEDKPDDLQLKDFSLTFDELDEATSKIEIDSLKPKEFGNIKQAINRSLSHITKTRLKYKPLWQISKMFCCMDKTIEAFEKSQGKYPNNNRGYTGPGSPRKQ